MDVLDPFLDVVSNVPHQLVEPRLLLPSPENKKRHAKKKQARDQQRVKRRSQSARTNYGRPRRVHPQ